MSADTATSRTRAPARGPRRRFDHDAAYAFYASLTAEERGYARVAAAFGVSDVTVGKVARRDNWDERVHDAERKASEKLAVRSIEDRQRDTIRVGERLRERILAADPEEIDLVAAIRALPRYAHLEQLFAGEATNRIELGEAQAVITAVMQVALRFVDRGQRGEFLGELDGAVGGLVAIDGGRL